MQACLRQSDAIADNVNSLHLEPVQKKEMPIMTMSTASIWSLFAKARVNKMLIMTLSTASDGSLLAKDKCAPFGKSPSTVHSS